MSNNPKERQQWIMDELKLNPILSFKDCFSKYLVMFSKTEVTFSKDWKTTQATHKDYQTKLNNAKDEVRIGMELESLKSGLKSKLDRLMFYQDQIDEMEKQLTGASKFMFIVGNKPVASHNSKGNFVLPLEKQNDIRKAIKEYQTEISKIEGDYASIKIGGDKENPLIINNPEEREARIAALVAKAKKSI